MLKRKFTVVSQLHETNNQDIIHYFEEARFTYAKAVRQSFHIIKNTSTFNKSHYNTALQKPTQPRSLPISIGRGIGE